MVMTSGDDFENCTAAALLPLEYPSNVMLQNSGTWPSGANLLPCTFRIIRNTTSPDSGHWLKRMLIPSSAWTMASDWEGTPVKSEALMTNSWPVVVSFLSIGESEEDERYISQ